MHMPHHILTTQMEPRGFTKSSAQNKPVHKEPSFRLSFYLRRSQEGYTVGNIAGFPVEIM
jgi:hypothetical protein